MHNIRILYGIHHHDCRANNIILYSIRIPFGEQPPRRVMTAEVDIRAKDEFVARNVFGGYLEKRLRYILLYGGNGQTKCDCFCLRRRQTMQ